MAAAVYNHVLGRDEHYSDKAGDMVKGELMAPGCTC